MSKTLTLKFYFAGITPETQNLIAEVQAYFKNQHTLSCNVEIIDIFEHPEQANEHNILATPSIVLEQATGITQQVLDGSTPEKFLFGVGIAIKNT